jgi:hypothetical protein
LTVAALGSPTFPFFSSSLSITIVYSWDIYLFFFSYEGVLVAFWFIDHAGMLRYYVLLMGVLSCWYVIFDVMDDFGQ